MDLHGVVIDLLGHLPDFDTPREHAEDIRPSFAVDVSDASVVPSRLDLRHLRQWCRRQCWHQSGHSYVLEIVDGLVAHVSVLDDDRHLLFTLPHGSDGNPTSISHGEVEREQR